MKNKNVYEGHAQVKYIFIHTYGRGITADAMAFSNLIRLQVVAVGRDLAVGKRVHVTAPVRFQDGRVGQLLPSVPYHVPTPHPARVIASSAVFVELPFAV